MTFEKRGGGVPRENKTEWGIMKGKRGKPIVQWVNRRLM